MARLEARVRRAVDEVLAPLTPEQRTQFHAMLRTVTEYSDDLPDR